AVTFSEWLLLVDGERAPAAQRRGFAAVTAHELAHIWFGDLVTMPWWDDLWLKEASATWMAGRTVTSLWPDLDDGTWALEAVHGAMDSDGLVSARKIRQEILSHHDIANAYDGITYQKGSGVISMIERWLGPSTYQRGVQKLMADRRFGTADVNDLMVALSAAAGRDVAGPFRSFLDQPGVPLVEASLSCDGPPALELRQACLERQPGPESHHAGLDQLCLAPAGAHDGVTRALQARVDPDQRRRPPTGRSRERIRRYTRRRHALHHAAFGRGGQLRRRDGVNADKRPLGRSGLLTPRGAAGHGGAAIPTNNLT
ncbi:MAG: hypothetical protein HUU27_07460, partial [Phycisphaerae bacterium]|nr:hypothetical protein [Phycisphaerae bacterium]